MLSALPLRVFRILDLVGNKNRGKYPVASYCLQSTFMNLPYLILMTQELGLDLVKFVDMFPLFFPSLKLIN